jgi:hypothetical protein
MGASYVMVVWAFFEGYWAYFGTARTPERPPVGDAAVVAWTAMVENPVELLIWGVALLTANGTAHPAWTGSVDGDAAAVGGIPQPGTRALDGPRPLVQISAISPHPIRAADVDLIVLIPTAGGPVRVRRLSGAASDLPAALPYLFLPDPGRLARDGHPGSFRADVEDVFRTPEEAVAEADADPEAWEDGERFRSWVEHDPGFQHLLRPSAQRVGAWGRVGVSWPAWRSRRSS